MTTLKVYRIVLASPSDVASDRETVVSSVEEANRLLFNRGVAFKIVRWESDVVPGVSTYPQAHINNQILEHFDVMIALFGARIGSPTPSSVSGTAEEIKIALDNDTSPFGDYRLATYFKRTSIDSYDGDADQLLKLQSFRRSLQNQNVLTEAYDDERALAVLIRRLLFRLVEVTADGSTVSSTASQSLPQEEAIEEGILDLLEKYQHSMHEANKHLGLAAGEMTKFNENTDGHAKAIAQVSNDSSVTARKQTTNEFAAMMNSTADALTLHLNSARIHMNAALDFANSVVNMQLTDIGSDQRELLSLSEQLENLKLVAINAAVAWHGAGIQIQNLPRLTKEVNLAKRSMMKSVEILDELSLETSRKIDSILEKVEIVLKTYE